MHREIIDAARVASIRGRHLRNEAERNLPAIHNQGRIERAQIEICWAWAHWLLPFAAANDSKQSSERIEWTHKLRVHSGVNAETVTLNIG